MSTENDELLATTLIDDLAHQPIEGVRALRDECVRVETGLSYARRLVQGPLDIVELELRRRSAGEAHSELSALIDELPEVLSANTRSGGNGRLATELEPSDFPAEVIAEIDSLVGDGQLGEIPTLEDTDLTVLADGLREVERKISERRRSYHLRIDALQAELTRRYSTGEASVDSLLT